LNKVALLVYGCSGAGKGSLLRFLKVHADLDVIETGPWCRAHPEHQEHAQKGHIVGNGPILDFAKSKIDESRAAHIALDCPRTGDQVREMVQLFRESGYTSIYAVFVRTSKEQCRLRMAKRARDEGRFDDACPEATAQRFKNFSAHKQDVLQGLHQHCLRTYLVDGDGAIDSLEAHAERIAQDAGMLSSKAILASKEMAVSG